MLPQKLLGILIGVLCLPAHVLAGGPNPKGVEFFENKVRPVLSKYCYECHSGQAKKLKAGLLLDSRDGMLKGGDSGPVLVPGKANESLIIKALEHDGPTKMPSQSTKLPKEIVADFVKWIDMGAPDPRTGKAVSKKKEIDLAKGRAYWAFQPLRPMAPPRVKNMAWGRTPVDRFILAKLEAKGLAPNGPINRERLIRRAYFDLHGLPPAPADFEAFVNDPSPDAYDKLIDRLLQSEHVGERWARHWLDTVRFAESGGYEFDGNRPAAYHYRDFVIQAAQPGHAVRPVHPLADCRRPACAWQSSGDRGHRLSRRWLVPWADHRQDAGADPLRSPRRHDLHASARRCSGCRSAVPDATSTSTIRFRKRITIA